MSVNVTEESATSQLSTGPHVMTGPANVEKRDRYEDSSWRTESCKKGREERRMNINWFIREFLQNAGYFKEACPRLHDPRGLSYKYLRFKCS